MSFPITSTMKAFVLVLCVFSTLQVSLGVDDFSSRTFKDVDIRPLSKPHVEPDKTVVVPVPIVQQYPPVQQIPVQQYPPVQHIPVVQYPVQQPIYYPQIQQYPVHYPQYPIVQQYPHVHRPQYHHGSHYPHHHHQYQQPYHGVIC